MSANWRTSSIPRTKLAIVNLLSGLDWPGGSDVPVYYGAPRDFSREDVIIGDTSSSTQDWASLGDLQRQEEYELGMYVRVIRPGDSQQEATERAFELFGVIEMALRATPTLGVPGVLYVHIATPSLSEGVLEEGYGAVIESAVAVKARI